jgi:hypothetical protein
MIENSIKITWIAPGFSFNGYRKLQLKYDAEDRVLSIKRADGFIKDIKNFYIRVISPCNSPIKKVMPVIPFSPVLPYRFLPSS